VSFDHGESAPNASRKRTVPLSLALPRAPHQKKPEETKVAYSTPTENAVIGTSFLMRNVICLSLLSHVSPGDEAHLCESGPCESTGQYR
jgi:hypothetical protein